MIDANEVMVMAAWEKVGIKHFHIDDVQYWVIHQNGSGIPLRGSESPDLAWAAAAAFTRERQEEIRQVREEIRKVDHQRRLDISHVILLSKGAEVYGRDAARWERLMSRLESALDEMQRGMK